MINTDPTLRFTAKQMRQFKRSQMTLGEFVSSNKISAPEDPLFDMKILRICASATGATIEKTMSKSRESNAVFARYMAMYFMKKFKKGLFLRDLGALAGERHHATVLWGIKTVEQVADTTYPGDFRRDWLNKAIDKIKKEFGNII